MAQTVDKSSERVKRMFSAISSKYDLMNHLLSCNIDKSWRNKVVKTIPPLGDAPILDACTGTGDLAIAYWQATHGKTPVIGTDFCAEMLALAEKKKTRLSARENLTFLEADTLHLPFPDHHFQIVTVAFGLRNVEDTRGGLDEIRRVCRPGGRVGILEFSQPHVWPLSSLYQAYFRLILPRLGQFLSRNQESAYSYLPASVAEFPSGEALANLMRTAGFRAVHFMPLTMGIATLYVGTK
jgi:demethylmenaquinone methyltransferase / 2-methoxy-6-polyprenyl-1,4-benzoquinol methylase